MSAGDLVPRVVGNWAPAVRGGKGRGIESTAARRRSLIPGPIATLPDGVETERADPTTIVARKNRRERIGTRRSASGPILFASGLTRRPP